MPTDPALLRRLLRAKDRMDAASHEAWPVRRLAGGVSAAHFVAGVQGGVRAAAAPLPADAADRGGTALLRDTDLPILDIALQTGWNSLGTFGRTFRDITGASPPKWQMREQSAPHARGRCRAS